MTGTYRLNTGDNVWFDGAVARLVQLAPKSSVLETDTGTRSVSTSYLLSTARPLTQAGNSRQPPSAELLSSLTTSQHAALRSRLSAVEAVFDLQQTTGESINSCCETVALADGQASARSIKRWVASYEHAGPAGLTDSRRSRSPISPAWQAACLEVTSRYTRASTPGKNVVIDQIEELLINDGNEASIPSQPTAYRWLDELTKGRHTFGSGKNRRSVANRPKGPYGRLRATRPGEYVVMDTTRLDVFAMEPVTLRWVPVELTVAQDLFTRCILGLRLTPVSTNSGDVANVLHQVIVPQEPEDDDAWPFHGVPQHVLIGTENPDDAVRPQVAGMPGCLPEAIVVDHGKVFLSQHIMAACARLGISIQPAIPHKPTDKPTVERFFKTLREGLLQHLPSYKGPDVFNRGDGVEAEAFLYVSELERIIREWVSTVYHRTKHDGLCVSDVDGLSLSPSEMYEVGLARAGGLLIPQSADLAHEFLDVRWRTIQHYGVEIDGRRYDGAALNQCRNRKSLLPGANAGKWPIYVDVNDVRHVYFRDPESHEWSALRWEHADGLGQPFSAAAADYTKRLAVRSGRHVDPRQAVEELLRDWKAEEVTSRRERALAKRLASARATQNSDADSAPDLDLTSLPGVVDLLAARETRRPVWDLDDDIEVFEREYTTDNTRFEVFDE